MRLWHEDLIKLLPRQQLLGQHRECCALRGKGWGRPHSTVNYVFKHPVSFLIRCHKLVMDEMKARGYKPDFKWQSPTYRGTALGYGNQTFMSGTRRSARPYPEHNYEYLVKCIENLKAKGVDLDL